MKIGIIGAGYVGSATAFSLLMCGVAEEIVLVNRTFLRAKAEAIDIRDSLPTLSNSIIKYGDFHDLQGSNIVLLTCGKNRGGKNVDRMTLLHDNAQMVLEMLPKIESHADGAIIIVASNPVDVLASLILCKTKADPSKIIASGTVLDTSRFRSNIAEHFNVSVNDVHADVFGEHGNSQVPIWSTATINGHLIDDNTDVSKYSLSDDDRMSIDHTTKYGADIVVAGKQATCFGIAGALTSICKSIKENIMLPLNVSCFHDDCLGVHDVFVSTPTIVGIEGVKQLLPYSLTQKEAEQLEQSVQKTSQATQEVLSLIL